MNGQASLVNHVVPSFSHWGEFLGAVQISSSLPSFEVIKPVQLCVNHFKEEGYTFFFLTRGGGGQGLDPCEES